MPIIEAMSQGCIPVAINHSSLPEIMGDAGILLNSSDPHEIGQAISRCCKDNDFSKVKVRLGRGSFQDLYVGKVCKRGFVLLPRTLKKISELLRNPLAWIGLISFFHSQRSFGNYRYRIFSEDSVGHHRRRVHAYRSGGSCGSERTPRKSMEPTRFILNMVWAW